MSTAYKRAHHIRIVQSRQNARVKELRAAFARASRTESGLLAIEGEHLLQEAASSGLKFHTVFVEQGSEALLDRLQVPATSDILVLLPEVFTSAVHTESPQGIAALVDLPSFTLEKVLAGVRPLVLIAAGLQDPGNLGTLIRSAEAFGATGCVVLPGTVSPDNQKTMRASAGSIFRLPCVIACEDHVFHELAQRGIRTLAAVATGGQPPAQLDLARPCALIVGNEGSGIPPSLLRRADARVTISTPGPVESLNAAIAGSILLYEAARQRQQL
ncbi:MAG TPA: RNA methyltransferase [Acidobacteriaceae bacterium]|nr:RNA methyltransferase [Acidobacteriaceae bacterium]